MSKDNETGEAVETFYSRLKTCLYVQQKYKDAFRNLRDSLGGSLSLSSFPSVSSLITPDQQSSNNSQRDSRKRRVDGYHGILMSEEEVIFNHLDEFCKRLKLIIDEIQTLAQFDYLYKTSTGLSRPKKDDLGYDLYEDEELELNVADVRDTNDQDLIEEHITREMGVVIEKLTPESTENSMAPPQQRKMDTLVEESEEFSSSSVQVIAHEQLRTKEANDEEVKALRRKQKSAEIRKRQEAELKQQLQRTEKFQNPEAERLFKEEQRIEADTKIIIDKAQSLSKEDIKLMSLSHSTRRLSLKIFATFSFFPGKYYNKTNDGPTIMNVIEGFLDEMRNNVKSVSAKQMIDVETKSSFMWVIA
jgi:hypothetical protein